MEIYSIVTYPKNFYLFVQHVGIKDAEIYADFKIEKSTSNSYHSNSDRTEFYFTIF